MPRLQGLPLTLVWIAIIVALMPGTLPPGTPLSGASALAADDGPSRFSWPQFLGPGRNGVSKETGLLKSWPAVGPKVVFRAKGGAGMSAVSILNGRAVTMAHRGGKQTVLALDAETGKTLQEVAVAPEYPNAMGRGPRGTPALVGDMAYVFTGEGILAAVDLAKGRVVWSRDTLDEWAGREADYGMACSPLVVDDLVVVTPGASKGTVVAYDRATGEPKWQAVSGGGRDTSGYSSPTLLTLGGAAHVVAFGGKAAVGLDPKTGAQRWRHPFVTDFDCNTATPIAHDGRLLISAGENHGSELLAVDAKDFQVEQVWTSHGAESVLRSEWQTPILLDGAVYGMDNVGGAGPVTHLTCIDFATGKRLWQEKRFGKGNLIAADGKLFVITIQGELVILNADPTKFVELGRERVLGATRQAPSLANGRLYLRDDAEILCIDLRAAKD